jgi:transposase InsO family protein
VLEQIVAERGQLQAIRCDNGPELTSRHFLSWCVERQIELLHIQPGKPTQNAHVESFHGRLREECLARSRPYPVSAVDSCQAVCRPMTFHLTLGLTLDSLDCRSCP